MLDHSVDKRLRKLANPWCCRTKFPKITNLFRSFTALKIAPEMILNRRFACSPSFTHNYSLRRSDITLAISTAARAASVPRLILFSRQRSRA
jgi:hypothetical protein